MSLTVQQIVNDAKRLVNNIKDHDLAADALLSRTQAVCKQVDAMRQYKEDVDELNESARQRPHSVLVSGIQQENRHLRELQQENRELKAALEEHQNALELIMSKYRQQVSKLVNASKVDLKSMLNDDYAQAIEKQATKISEMASVMKTAALIDEQNNFDETIGRLTTENKGLRELLDISRKFGTPKLGVDTEESEKEETMPMEM